MSRKLEFEEWRNLYHPQGMNLFLARWEDNFLSRSDIKEKDDFACGVQVASARYLYSRREQNSREAVLRCLSSVILVPQKIFLSGTSLESVPRALLPVESRRLATKFRIPLTQEEIIKFPKKKTAKVLQSKLVKKITCDTKIIFLQILWKLFVTKNSSAKKEIKNVILQSDFCQFCYTSTGNSIYSHR